MNKLIADVFLSLEGNTIPITIMVIDYILCTITVAEGEEREVLKHIQGINTSLGITVQEWHSVFTNEMISLAMDGKVKVPKTGEILDKGIAFTYKGLCGKRAALYKEKRPDIVTMAGNILPNLLSGP